MLKTTTLAATMLVALAGVARAQAPGQTPPSSDGQGYYDDGDYDYDGDGDYDDQAAAPPVDQPSDQIPSMPQDIPSPPDTQVIVTANDTAGGQWVYTDQYGWIWIPYGDQYAYAGDYDSGVGYAYVYYPSYGWMWLSAPWVVGWGARPYFGHYGYAH